MSTTITVTTQAQLLAALGRATGGETILLAPGDYGALELATRSNININFASEVTIASANPKDPAVFTGLNMRGASNLIFDGVTFDYRAEEGAPVWARPFQIFDSSDITIRNGVFDGDLARGVDAVSDGYATGAALSVRDSHAITIERNEVSTFARGFVFDNVADLAVTRNDLHALRIDGLNFANVQNVLIAGNHIHDFVRAPDAMDHCDMIQFWTNGTTRPSTDIIIRNNRLDIGQGDPTQAIFMRNEVVDQGLAGPEMFYRNVTIVQNTIVNGHSHGITVGETAGLVIRSNSVFHADKGNPVGPTAEVNIPRITVSAGSTDVLIARNATSAITGHDGQADWVLRKNAFVQDQNPLAPGWYGDVLVASSRELDNGAHKFVALPGGMLDILDAGAWTTLNPGRGTGPLFHVTGAQFSDHLQTFDAGIMGALPAGTTVLWDFGDGTTATGATVTHAFAASGRYAVTLSLRGTDGTRNDTTLPLSIADAEFLRLDRSGSFVVFVDGEQHLLAPAEVHNPDGLQLGAAGVAASVARAHVVPLLDTTGATIALTLKADTVGATGEIARLHGSFVLGVNSAGAIELTAWSDTGQQAKLVTTGVIVNDRASHVVGINLSDGVLGVTVDGRQAAATAFSGNFADSGTHPLTFGNPWGKANFHGDLAAFSISLQGDAGVAQAPVAFAPAAQHGLWVNSLPATGAAFEGGFADGGQQDPVFGATPGGGGAGADQDGFPIRMAVHDPADPGPGQGHPAVMMRGAFHTFGWADADRHMHAPGEGSGDSFSMFAALHADPPLI